MYRACKLRVYVGKDVSYRKRKFSGVRVKASLGLQEAKNEGSRENEGTCRRTLEVSL